MLASALIMMSTGSAIAEGFVVQFSGSSVPDKVVSYVNIERVAPGECEHSCVLTSKEYNFPKGDSGSAARRFPLPKGATRVCAHISSDVVIGSAHFFSTSNKKTAIHPGEDYGQYNGEAYNDFGGDKWVYFSCTPLNADASSGIGLVITLK